MLNVFRLFFRIGLCGAISWSFVACTSIAGPLFPICENGLYGYIDSLGKEVIKPSYILALPYSDNVALVVTDTMRQDDGNLRVKYSYIDYSGKAIYDKQLTAFYSWQRQIDYNESFADFISRFVYSEGRALFQCHDNSPNHDEILDSANQYGYLDKKGNIVIPCQYNDGDVFHYGKTMVNCSRKYAWENGIDFKARWKIIDRDGRSLTDYIYASNSAFSHNRCLAIVLSKDSDPNILHPVYVLMNEEAKVIKTFDRPMKMLSDGHLVQQAGVMVAFGWQSSFFDKEGNELVKASELPLTTQQAIIQSPGFFAFDSENDFKISYVKDCADGLFLCTSGNRDSDCWFFTDGRGDLFGKAKTLVFEDAMPFSCGLAPIKQEGKWGFINRSFEVVIPCQYAVVEQFKDNLAYAEIVYSNYKVRSYINKRGIPVWQEQIFE